MKIRKKVFSSTILSFYLLPATLLSCADYRKLRLSRFLKYSSARRSPLRLYLNSTDQDGGHDESFSCKKFDECDVALVAQRMIYITKFERVLLPTVCYYRHRL